MSKIDFIIHIRKLIARDDLSKAIDQLQELLANTPLLDEAIQQSGRFENIRRQIRLGIINHKEANLTQNEIRAGLLDLLREIEIQSELPNTQREVERAISIFNSKNVVVGSTFTGNVTIGDTTTVTESPTSQRLRLFLFLFVPLLTIGSAYLWQRNRELQRPLQLKVRVENRTPNPELPEPTAQIILTYGAKQDIKGGTETEYLFEGIPANFQNKQVQLQFSASGFESIDTTISLDMELLALPVRRNDDLAKIKGIVSDEKGNPINGVKVSIACCNSITDDSGLFEMVIPPKHQRTRQRIDLFKEGYAPFRGITTPVIPGELVRLTL